MSLKYFHKYNIYYGNQSVRTSVWMTLWPKVGAKPVSSYNWNRGFIFFPRSLIFLLLHRAIYFAMLQQLTFVFLNLAKIPDLPVFYQEVMEGGKEGKEPSRRQKRGQKSLFQEFLGHYLIDMPIGRPHL